MSIYPVLNSEALRSIDQQKYFSEPLYAFGRFTEQQSHEYEEKQSRGKALSCRIASALSYASFFYQHYLLESATFEKLGISTLLPEQSREIARQPFHPLNRMKAVFGNQFSDFSVNSAKKKLLFLRASEDHNHALWFGHDFNRARLQELSSYYDVKHEIIHEPLDICRAIHKSAQKAKVGALWIASHGWAKGLYFGVGKNLEIRDLPHNVSILSTNPNPTCPAFDLETFSEVSKRYFPFDCFNGLAESAPIVLEACDTGGNEVFDYYNFRTTERLEHSFAQTLATFSGRRVVAFNDMAFLQSLKITQLDPLNVKPTSSFFPICPANATSYHCDVNQLVCPIAASYEKSYVEPLKHYLSTIWEHPFAFQLFMMRHARVCSLGLRIFGHLLNKATDYSSPLLKRVAVSKGIYNQSVGSVTFRVTKLFGRLAIFSGDLIGKATDTLLWLELKCVAKTSRFTGWLVEITSNTFWEVFRDSRVRYVFYLGIGAGKVVNSTGKALEWVTNKMFKPRK